jgi:hypothetical protein
VKQGFCDEDLDYISTYCFMDNANIDWEKLVKCEKFKRDRHRDVKFEIVGPGNVDSTGKGHMEHTRGEGRLIERRQRMKSSAEELQSSGTRQRHQRLESSWHTGSSECLAPILTGARSIIKRVSIW